MRPRLFALAALCTLWAGLGGSRRASVAVRCLCVGPVDVTGGVWLFVPATCLEMYKRPRVKHLA